MALAALVPLQSIAGEVLSERSIRDRRALRQWELDGTPRGVAVSGDGTIYVGLAEYQEIVAIDPESGRVRARKEIDRTEIAATKDFVSMRATRSGDRLVIGQGSDESVTIVSLPDLAIVREIGLEGEVVRDAVPAPDGSFIAVLGRNVHIWSRDGESLLHVLERLEPMALAVSPGGGTLAVMARETFPSGTVSVAVLFDTRSWRERARRPLQTDRLIRGAFFSEDGQTLAVWADDWLAEVPVTMREQALETGGERARVSIGFGDLVSSEAICLPQKSGPQVAVLGGDTVVLAERRCSSGGSFVGGKRRLQTAALIGVEAWAIAWDRPRERIIATNPAGTLTMYRVPAPASR